MESSSGNGGRRGAHASNPRCQRTRRPPAQCQPRRRRPPSANVTLDGGAGTPAGAVSSISAWNALAAGPGAAGSAGGRASSSTQVAFMAAAANAYSSLIWSMYAGVGVSARASASAGQQSLALQHLLLVLFMASACQDGAQGDTGRPAGRDISYDVGTPAYNEARCCLIIVAGQPTMASVKFNWSTNAAAIRVHIA